MKELKSIKFYSALTGLFCFSLIFSSVFAQEYDDMYFNKSDRKKIKAENNSILARDNKNASSIDYSEAAKTTEVYSAKNVNPEYIARYKATESNEVPDAVRRDNYSSNDYFIENYNIPDSAIGSHQNQIDYAALNKRDQMSYSNHNRNNFNPYWGRPSWGFSPYMSMGYGYNPYYDPFMMGYGYGSGMSLGMSYGFGNGFYPSMSYSMSMSWGTGYNPWSSWGGYPYSPYSMRGFYDPWGWGPSSAYNGFSPYYGYGYGMGRYYGYSRPVYVISGHEYGNSVAYKPRRSSRSATSTRVVTRNAENSRISSAESKIRVPNRTVSSASNGRISRDYSKTQNEYYRNTRSTSSSRISSSQANRNSYARSSYSSSRYNNSSISSNRPSRVSNSSSGYNRSNSNSSFSNYNGSRSNSSFSSPSRSSSSSFNRSSYSSGSGSRSSSYSSGRSSGSSSRSSGSSRSGGRQ